MSRSQERILRRAVEELLAAAGLWRVWTTGVSACGVPDVVGVCRGRFFAWELKQSAGRTARLQRRNAEEIIRNGGQCRRVTSLDDAREALSELEGG